MENLLPFVNTSLIPHANAWDQAQAIPESVIQEMANLGYLGATIAPEFGGLGWTQEQAGVLYREVGRGCSSVRSLLTVHLALVSETLQKWGTEAQKAHWLPQLASGKTIAAFGLSEPEAGSDAQGITTSYSAHENGYLLRGTKTWITFGQRADVYLIVARNEDSISTFLVPRTTPGFTVTPLQGMLGTTASGLATLQLDDCIVPGDALLGKEGWGFMQIVNTALDNGRFSVACGSLGIAEAALALSIDHANTRKTFGHLLREHQLIKQKIANLLVEVKAARALCRTAAQKRDEHAVDAIMHTTIAKYHASKLAQEAGTQAVQILGAKGCHADNAAQRLYRDAKVMEIIEGSSEMQQIMISDYAIKNWRSLLD